MPKKWSKHEEHKKYEELFRLYVKQNKTIGEIAGILAIAEQTVFKRMKKLGIRSTPWRKTTYIAKRRKDIKIPKNYSGELAEFIGIMLGDGHLSHYQFIITLGTKELAYAEHVVKLVQKVFGAKPKIGFRKTGAKDVYLGSVALAAWFKKEGLVYNKVLSQVAVPKWIFDKKEYMQCFLRGFFDTDGSVYKLHFGSQISFTNKSLPLLRATHRILALLDYKLSSISGYKIYLTRQKSIRRFFAEIKPNNPKHLARFRNLV